MMLFMNYILELSLVLIRISEELEMEHEEWGQTSQLTYDEGLQTTMEFTPELLDSV